MISGNAKLLAATLAMISLAAQADVLVGVAGPMTGQYASGGDQMRKGVEAAINDINAKGGILGQKLKAEVADDACDPKQAVSVANSLSSKKVAVLVGHYCSSSTIPASEVYNEFWIPMITTSTSPKVTDRGLKNIFRITGRDDQESIVVADYLAAKFMGKKIA